MANVDAQKMREIAKIISREIPGVGFALLTFPKEQSELANYISNASREIMVKALEETLARWKAREDFMTPESN